MMQKRIDEIRARESAATLGPWIFKPGGFIETAKNVPLGKAYPPTQFIPYGDGYKCVAGRDGSEMPNADFIAHAREDIPYLLDALAATMKRAEALERAVKEYAPCLTCVRETPGNAETCGNCEYWTEGPGVDGWQFDHARFKGGLE